MTTASVYTGFKLDDKSVQKLIDISRRGGLTPYSVQKGQHITLKFRGDPRKLPIDLVGQTFAFQVLAIRDHAGLQTVMLDPGDEVVRELTWASPPHVTLSHRLDVKPSTSKSRAFSFRDAGPCASDLTFDEDTVIIYGTLGFMHDRHNWMFSIPSDAELVPTPRLEKRA